MAAKKASRFFWSSDYAGLIFPGGEFYYGYEVTKPRADGSEEWCFRAKFDGGTEIVMTSSKLGGDEFNPREVLMNGICDLLDQGRIKIEITKPD